MDGFEFHVRHPVRVTDDYSAVLDEYRRGGDQFLIAHIDFFNFSPRIMGRFLREWRAFRACTAAPIFAYPGVDDAKWERFVRMLGFRFHQDVLGSDGTSRRLFVSLKDCRNAADFTEDGEHEREQERSAVDRTAALPH